MKLEKSEYTEILFQMLRIRAFEENLYQLYLQRQVPGMSPHLSVGQEAVAVGVCYGLRRQDFLLTTHRGHGHVLAKGADMNRMMAEIMGKETGYCHGRGGSMHIADASLNIIGANGIVGGGLPIALGSAMSSLYHETGAVTVCFFGDAANNIGTFHESLNMARVLNLPIIWVCENNQYGLSTNIKDTLASESIAGRASAYDMPGCKIDGNDVSAVYEEATRAIERARSGQGPSLIEAITYRWYGHGASDNRSYRTKEEEKLWRTKCPIENFTEFLLGESILSENEIEILQQQSANEVAQAIEFANESALPNPADVMNYIFSTDNKI